jgi:hypothetical protein
MLFFKPPTEIHAWLANPSQSFFLADIENSYHYSLKIMQDLAAAAITPRLNVGVIGLKSEEIDWDKLESWLNILERKEGKTYLLEQALSAMLAAGKPLTIASENAYIVMPDQQEIKNPTAVLHHYVAGSKEWYFKCSWKMI